MCILPYIVFAQDKAAARQLKHKDKKTTTVPLWAKAHNYDATSHAYFPDYHAFYDPNRGGYIFWEKGSWSFTPTIPPYMDKVDLSQSRVKILKGLSLDLHPELDHPHYMELYPPDPNNNTRVPVPIPGTPGTGN